MSTNKSTRHFSKSYRRPFSPANSTTIGPESSSTPPTVTPPREPSMGAITKLRHLNTPSPALRAQKPK